ncbi:MAG: formylmethanofuran dehydrogenase [Methanobrevibacter sp.]|uniref:Formylmethanofuran dehydrogenase n=1 Tax=Methanobrevibacter millerae TaxID=230361 RepID=A0A8T3VKF0_9EURY|nr:molybdopterin dinucleotide binding domain-containing protein [Methanobrevibacter sp.]MBE6509881.1 formylmethanofuran dehydrogenase [Methanobrevibacter millerae]MBO5151586.1 formylmethanofuran dehydrogenase [Methanobrevibacter sp.]
MHYANTYLEKPVVPDVKITGEGNTDVLKCMLNTGSDIYQGACKKRGSTLKEEYKNASGTCYMDPRDMAKLGVNNWDTVLVKTDFGEVVVNCAVSRDAPHEGTVFICKGPWANTVVSHDTYCCSDPTYKGIKCTVEKTDREVLLMADLMRWVYKKYVDETDDDVVEKMDSLGELPVYKGRKWEELIDHDL